MVAVFLRLLENCYLTNWCQHLVLGVIELGYVRYLLLTTCVWSQNVKTWIYHIILKLGEATCVFLLFALKWAVKPENGWWPTMPKLTDLLSLFSFSWGFSLWWKWNQIFPTYKILSWWWVHFSHFTFSCLRDHNFCMMYVCTHSGHSISKSCIKLLCGSTVISKFMH